jgi:hypothetical protein
MTPAAALIAGQVHDANGQPVALARVAFVDGPGPIPDVGMLTGADGSFTLSAPAAGIYRIGIYSDDHLPLTATVTAAAGASVKLQLILQDGAG